ncbi:hypothetical protein [Kitasatospora purpeofusca]|uniref:hypothetical protein n=1 Tax=Kitasatospora purpeofusca TaxID=67352 RepID=UPI0038250B24
MESAMVNIRFQVGKFFPMSKICPDLQIHELDWTDPPLCDVFDRYFTLQFSEFNIPPSGVFGAGYLTAVT